MRDVKDGLKEVGKGTYQFKFFEDFVRVVFGGELVELVVVAKDDYGDVDLAEFGELVGLLEEAAFALEEGAVAPQISIYICHITSR